MPGVLRGGVALACLIGLASPVAAQVSAPDSERPGEAARRGMEQLETEREASALSPLPPGQRVTFAEVLASPDDVELNFRWALTQIADGNLTGAAATLERILLLRPDLERVRMMHAVVLFKLGDLEHAQREFEKLDRDALPERHRRQIARYREGISKQRQRSRYFLALSVGSQADSNRNAGPDSNQALLADVRQSVATASKKTADQGWFSLGDLRIERDLGAQEDLKGVAGLTYFHSQQEDLQQLDIQAARFELGVRLRRGSFEIHPRLVSDVIDLSREVYLRTAGAQVSARLPLSPKVAMRADLRSVHEDYDSTPDATTARERTGYRSELSLDLDLVPRIDQRLTLSAGVTRKSAQKTYYSSLAWKAGVSHLWVLRSGPFLISSLEATGEKYHRSQDTVSASRRRDFQTTARTGFGIPLGILQPRSETLQGLTLTVSGEVLLADSNLPNFDYKNRKLMLSLSKRFEF